MCLFGQHPFFFGDLAMVFRVGDHVLKADLVFGEPLVRLLNQFIGQAELARNLKRVGFARNADGETVSRPQSFHVEFHAGVFHAWRAQGEGLQLAVVRGGHGRHAARDQMLQNGHGQRGALGGVGARAQFVEQGQRMLAHALEDFHDVRHVRRKGGKRLLDGLFVANIGKHLVEHRHFAAILRGNLQARLRH